MFFDKKGSRDWDVRRRIVIMTLLYCALVVAYALVWGQDNELYRAAVNGAYLLAGATIQGYVFGVIWDGKGKQPGVTTEVKQTVVTPAPAADPQPPPGMAEN